MKNALLRLTNERRAALRYAVHDSLVTAAFSGLFLLKMANLFPGELDLPAITGQVEQLAQLLSEVAAERFVKPLISRSSQADCLRSDMPSLSVSCWRTCAESLGSPAASHHPIQRCLLPLSRTT